MNQPHERKLRQLCTQVINETDPSKLLNIFLTLDRMVVERSLRVYKIPRHQRSIVREQNRRLHDAIRGHRVRRYKDARKVR
jgi:hypothetical protein